MILMVEGIWGACWFLLPVEVSTILVLCFMAAVYLLDSLDILHLAFFIVSNSNCTGPAIQIHIYECFGHSVAWANSLCLCRAIRKDNMLWNVITQILVVFFLPSVAFRLILALCILIKSYRQISILVKAKLLSQRNYSISKPDDQLQPLLIGDHDIQS